ncbi:MAG TPA: papain-like cysteine protease family protein [Rhizomicrobium sp.]|jgi:hypothetical protein|nr:papain-like cysteine protease family protein [Rhizomicrobium sp.]
MATAGFLGPFVDLPAAPRTSARAAALAAAAGDVLEVAMNGQQQTNWCWAAVAESVLKYLAPIDHTAALTQEQLADQYLRPPGSNSPYPLDSLLDDLGHLEDPVGAPMPFKDIASEIRTRRRPICCKIKWATGSDDHHYVLMIGCHGDTDADGEVVILDPDGDSVVPQPGTYLYEEFANSYSGGSWSDSYTTT